MPLWEPPENSSILGDTALLALPRAEPQLACLGRTTLDCRMPEPKETHRFSPHCRRCAIPCAGGWPASPPHRRVEEAALQSAAMLWVGADRCGATFSASLPSLAALGAAAPALDCGSCSEPASLCRDPRGLTASRTGGGQGKNGTQRAQQTWRVVEAQEEMQSRSWCRHSLGSGFKGPFQWIIALSCTWRGIFRRAPALMLCHRAGREKLPSGSGLGRQFYPQWAFIPIKKKYHRQAALPLWGGCKHPAAVVAVACAGVTGGEGLAVADPSCLEVLLLLCPS